MRDRKLSKRTLDERSDIRVVVYPAYRCAASITAVRSSSPGDSDERELLL